MELTANAQAEELVERCYHAGTDARKVSQTVRISILESRLTQPSCSSWLSSKDFAFGVSATKVEAPHRWNGMTSGSQVSAHPSSLSCSNTHSYVRPIRCHLQAGL